MIVIWTTQLNLAQIALLKRKTYLGRSQTTTNIAQARLHKNVDFQQNKPLWYFAFIRKIVTSSGHDALTLSDVNLKQNTE